MIKKRKLIQGKIRLGKFGITNKIKTKEEKSTTKVT